ncbi:hypothetical protein JG687_00017341 [Phytophthora cactorum]|uniref:SWIM-type domain-containing protein n=1 Tax=Phytophthora cactorum TaxID=29920 RepID=A0A8T1TQJ0_9STRA|nr:hypothetical protein JG687_00017341 [Phytophthora cactorum]
MDIYKVVVGRPFLVRYCMGDAEDAQINGVEQTLAAPSASAPSKPEVHYLMCFFHVVETLFNNSKYHVYRQIYEIPYARDATEFSTIQERADALWRALPEMKLCALLKKVISLCHHRSILHPTFATKPKPATTLIARAKRLLKAKKIVVTQPRHTVQFLLEGGASRQSEFHCRSLTDPEDNARNAEEGEWNNRRMERLGQPMIGWTVNLSTQTCGCRAFYKFGACVHLLASHKHANRKIAGWPGTKRRFVDRRVKRSKPSTGAQRGRPARVSHALSVD